MRDRKYFVIYSPLMLRSQIAYYCNKVKVIFSIICIKIRYLLKLNLCIAMSDPKWIMPIEFEIE